VAPRRVDREPRRGVRGVTMTRLSVRGLGAVAAACAMALFVALPAGAANSTAPKAKVGDTTVSNRNPMRGDQIDVSSDGWRPGTVVTIAIGSDDLLRATTDAHGRVKARVVVPNDATRGFDLLTVTGAAANGVPQQIVTGITVVVDHPAPAPARPWGVVFVLIAAAAVLLFLSRRVERRVRAPAAS